MHRDLPLPVSPALPLHQGSVLNCNKQQRPPPWREAVMNNEPAPLCSFEGILSWLWSCVARRLPHYCSCLLIHAQMGWASLLIDSFLPSRILLSTSLPSTSSFSEGSSRGLGEEPWSLDCPGSPGWRNQRWKWKESPSHASLPALPFWQPGLSGIQGALPRGHGRQVLWDHGS